MDQNGTFSGERSAIEANKAEGFCCYESLNNLWTARWRSLINTDSQLDQTDSQTDRRIHLFPPLANFVANRAQRKVKKLWRCPVEAINTSLSPSLSRFCSGITLHVSRSCQVKKPPLKQLIMRQVFSVDFVMLLLHNCFSRKWVASEFPAASFLLLFCEMPLGRMYASHGESYVSGPHSTET